MSVRPEPRHDRPPSAEVVTTPAAMIPSREPLVGRYSVVEPIDPDRHGAELFAATRDGEGAERIWDYLPYGPFASKAAFHEWLIERATSADPLFYALRDLQSGRASGMASCLNIFPANGSIEIGHIWFGTRLQKTPAATEALFLMMGHALDALHYRRLEWKCNALNARSRGAAVRLGFAFEGIFYQHMIVKGCNRDTAWFAILDHEWPRLRANFETWLGAANFDANGEQRTSLSTLNLAVRRAVPA